MSSLLGRQGFETHRSAPEEPGSNPLHAFPPADKARDFGAGPLFNQILPLLMSPTLEDQERHLLVKV